MGCCFCCLKCGLLWMTAVFVGFHKKCLPTEAFEGPAVHARAFQELRIHVLCRGFCDVLRNQAPHQLKCHPRPQILKPLAHVWIEKVSNKHVGIHAQHLCTFGYPMERTTPSSRSNSSETEHTVTGMDAKCKQQIIKAAHQIST